MSANHNERAATETAAIEEAAALWLARRDRGLSPAEQDEYIQWLAADRRHPEILAQHAAAFERMMKLYEWQPGHSAEANPDLFAPRSRTRRQFWAVGLSAAAALAIAATCWQSRDVAVDAPVASRSYLRVNERQALPDGSLAELKDGSQIEIDFSPGERRVRLKGEAHFEVAKNSIPFVVQVGTVSVQAVGTAFNVRTEPDAIDVLVTEGTVAVRRQAAPTVEAAQPAADGRRIAMSHSAAGGSVSAENLVAAGERAVVPIVRTEEVSVRPVSVEEAQAALAWKVPRLQFLETPLSVAVEEFNRWNRIRLVLDQRELGVVPIGGTFRIDNVESFVRLIEVTLEIRAVRQGDDKIVLTRKRAEANR